MKFKSIEETDVIILNTSHIFTPDDTSICNRYCLSGPPRAYSRKYYSFNAMSCCSHRFKIYIPTQIHFSNILRSRKKITFQQSAMFVAQRSYVKALAPLATQMLGIEQSFCNIVKKMSRFGFCREIPFSFWGLRHLKMVTTYVVELKATGPTSKQQ